MEVCMLLIGQGNISGQEVQSILRRKPAQKNLPRCLETDLTRKEGAPPFREYKCLIEQGGK